MLSFRINMLASYGSASDIYLFSKKKKKRKKNVVTDPDWSRAFRRDEQIKDSHAARPRDDDK